MDRDVLRPGWPCIQFQTLGLSDEVPKVVVRQFETKGWTVHMTLCAVCVPWAVQDEFPKLLMSTSVLFWCYFYE